ncbi:MAG: methyltransferase domain-containing protein [Paludibacter sp.]|nr:methyltransferase domain-containing protein [Paludibacter sp.]
MTDSFAKRATQWDSPQKVNMTDAFVAAMLKVVEPEKNWTALEIGAGTGLVGMQVLPKVKKMVFEDTSEAMLGVLKEKLQKSDNAQIVHGEVAEYKNCDIDFAFSCMAFHHIVDIDATLEHLATITRKGATIVVGDVRTEDGSFHHFEPIPHTGFDTDELGRQFEKAGFKVHFVKTYNILKRERTPGVISEYEQFMLVAQKI